VVTGQWVVVPSQDQKASGFPPSAKGSHEGGPEGCWYPIKSWKLTTDSEKLINYE